MLKPTSIFFSRNKTGFEFNEVEFADDDSRIIHSKILHFDGQKEFLLMGSPNMTRKALLMNASQGNIECSVFFMEIPAGTLIRGIDLTATANFEDLINSGREIETNDDEISILKIFSADFNDINRTLVIITEPLLPLADVHVQMEDSDFSIDNKFSLATGKIIIEKISKGNPLEVIISCDGKKGRRRIYYDRGSFIRNISRSPGSLNQLFERLSHDFSLDTSDIHAIILGLSRPPVNSSDESSKDQTGEPPSSKTHNVFSKPSKVHQVQNISSQLQRLNRAYQAVLSSQLQEYQRENEDPDSIPEEVPENKHGTDKQPNVAFNVELSNFIKAFDQLLCYRVAISEDKNNLLVSSQGCFIDVILRLFADNLTNNHISQIESILDENLKSADKSKCHKNARVSLFKSLLALNIIHDLHLHPSFLNKLFHYEDFLDQDTYKEIKEFIQKSLENDTHQKVEFDITIFRDHFCSLISFVFTSKTIGEGPIAIVRTMKCGNEEEYVEFLGTILLKLKNGAWDSPKGCFSLVSPQKHIREDKILLNGASPKIKWYVREFLT